MMVTIWLLHAGIAGLPALVAFFKGNQGRWGYSLALLFLPFLALLPAQILWPVGGASSYLARLIALTLIVLIAQIVKTLPVMRTLPARYHLLLLTAAVLAVVPLQLVVPALPD